MPLADGGSGAGQYLPFLFLIVIFVAMYFLFIRPQQRRARETQNMQSGLGPGDEVMTTSGIYGTVVERDDEAGTITLEVAPEVTITFARAAVGKVIARLPREDEESYTEEAVEGEEPAAEHPAQPTESTVGGSMVQRKD